jgi:flagellar assembly protein FliH
MSDSLRKGAREPGVLRDVAAQRWSMPTMSGPVIGRRRGDDECLAPETRTQAETIFAEARTRGLAAARAEVDAKVAELDARIARLDAVLGALARPLAELDDEVERQLAALAVAIARQLVRRELKSDPSQVIAVIREAVGRLPAAARDVRVHLHPEDATIVRDRLAITTADRAWSVVDDPILSRGGCVVRTDTSQIDARLESRIAAIVGSLLDDQRGTGRPGDSP